MQWDHVEEENSSSFLYVYICFYAIYNSSLEKRPKKTKKKFAFVFKIYLSLTNRSFIKNGFLFQYILTNRSTIILCRQEPKNNLKK